MEPQLILTSDHTAIGLDDRHLRRAVASGRLARLRRGVFLRADEWAALDRDAKPVAVIRAAMQALPGSLVASHESAAALWGLAIRGPWPDEVHVIDPRRRTGHRTRTLVRHATGLEPVVAVRHGVRCTTAARTAVDIGLTGGFAAALVAMDSALRHRLVTTSDLVAEAALRPGVRGATAARRAAGIADPGAGSAGESLSRATMHELGLPRPVLQKRFPNSWGGSYYVDFWWAAIGLVGEFDGDRKYLDASMRSGRTIEQVILDEKRRADDLRALPEVQNLVRWKFAAAGDPRVLSRILLAAGLTPGPAG